MPEHEKIEELKGYVVKYINTNCELIKLEATERISLFLSGLIGLLLVGSIATLFILFASFSIGFYLSTLLGNSYAGFIIVAGFYLLLGLILVLVRKKLIERPLRDKIIWKLLSKHV